MAAAERFIEVNSPMWTSEDIEEALAPDGPEWIWSDKFKGYMDEQSGEWLRRQFYVDENGKPVYRTVRVDEDDHERIMEVKR